MLTFFRRIRKGLLGEGATSKYLFYAIGEIALVVIGILIALQINNWNELKKEKKRSRIYLENIKTDFENHLEEIKATYNSLEFTKDCAKYVANYVNGDLEILDTFKLITCLNRAAYIINFNIQNSTWDEIISVGDLKLIDSKLLKSQISYFQSLYELMTELEERKYSPVCIEYLNYSSRFFDVSNDFQSTSTTTSFSKEGIWVDYEGLYKNDEIYLLLKKVFRTAVEQQDFITTVLERECKTVLKTVEDELKT